MKKISIAILSIIAIVTIIVACKKTPEVNLEYVDVERDLITVGTTTATIQCDYEYIATLKKAFLYYGEDTEEADMTSAEMRVVQNTLYVDLSGLKENTTYSYYYEFYNGFNSMRTEAKTFKTENSPGGGGGDFHEWVDLGLPSGTLWATCNVGANSPEEYGEYFAWGETEPKSYYDWSTYKYCQGDRNSMTKYCNMTNYGYNGYIDNLTVLEANDDAAVVNWGNEWCMPSFDQWRELWDHSTSVWTIKNGVQGLLFTANNGNSLFFPAAGHYEEVGLCMAGIDGTYASSQLFTEDPSDNRCASVEESTNFGDCVTLRSNGLSVRPVRKTVTPTPPGNIPEGAINGLFTINENGDQVYFSQGNLQYQASTNTWRFAENQWNYVGGVDHQTGVDCGNVYENGVKCDNSLLSSTYVGWIDLFGWGTSGWNNGNKYFHPWDSSYDVGTQNIGYGYGPTDGTNYSFDLTGVFANSDWGIFNTITNGGNVLNQWRTLTQSEWAYLLENRSTVSGVRYARALLNDIKGVVLLPDDWNVSTYTLYSTNENEAVPFSTNVITIEEWAILEANGVVFLPLAGLRGGDSSFSANEGTYWLASVSHNSNYEAYCFGFADLGPYSESWSMRYMGFSVRLVQDANR